MIPTGFPDTLRQQLLSPEIMVAPLPLLVSEAAGPVSGKRISASRWDISLPVEQAIPFATENAEWAF